MPVEQDMSFLKLQQAYQKTLTKKPLKWKKTLDDYYSQPAYAPFPPEPEESKSATDRALETLLKDVFDAKDIEVLRSYALQAIRMATTARIELKKLEEENIEILNRINEPEEDL